MNALTQVWADPKDLAAFVLAFAALTTFLAGFSAFRWHDHLDKADANIENQTRHFTEASERSDVLPMPSELRRLAQARVWGHDPIAVLTLVLAIAAAVFTSFVVATAPTDRWPEGGSLVVRGSTIMHAAIAITVLADYVWVSSRKRALHTLAMPSRFSALEALHSACRSATGTLRNTALSQLCALADEFREFVPEWCWVDLIEADAFAAAGVEFRPGVRAGLLRCISKSEANRSTDDRALMAWCWAQALLGREAGIVPAELVRLRAIRAERDPLISAILQAIDEHQ